MAPQSNINQEPLSAANADKKSGETVTLSDAVKLTPLELNNIRLDVRHTILTPDYLEKLISSTS